MKTHHKVTPVSKKPSAGRYAFICLTLGALLASPSTRAKTWTLDEAKKQVGAHGRFEELADAMSEREQAAGRAALPWTNPFIGYQREQSLGASSTGNARGAALSGQAEDYLWLGQTFDLSFRRGLLEDAGGRRAVAAKLRAEERRRDVLLQFEHLFYRALASFQRRGIAERWLQRLEELAAKTRAREAQGDASRYDVLRIEREISLAEQRRTQIDLQHQAEQAELAAWLDDDEAPIALDGELRPGPVHPSAPEYPRPLVAMALDEEANALTLEKEATGRWYLPPVTVTAGGKTVLSHVGQAPQTGELGYLFTLQVPIPAFNRGGARHDELAAAKRVAAAEAEMETHHVHKRLAAARAVWVGALVALDEHDNRASDRAQTLVETARAAWAGGELSLLALLEAERTALDDELVAINLSMAARNAQLAYAALTMEMPL